MPVLYLVCDSIAILVLLGAIYLMLRPMIFGAIYFPTTPASVEVIRQIAAPKLGEKIADLGSGDGRIVMALAAAGAEAHGYEVNPLLVRRSRRAIRKAGLEGKAFIHWTSFWRADLHQYDAVFVYGFPHIMEKLGKKLKRDLHPGALVISNIFRFPNLTLVRDEHRVRVYKI
jgi:ribosomal protein L11 methylase PrmA